MSCMELDEESHHGYFFCTVRELRPQYFLPASAKPATLVPAWPLAPTFAALAADA